MTDAGPRFRRGISTPGDRVEVGSVEVVPFPGDRSVVRLAGRWQGAPATASQPPLLHIDDGMRTQAFEAMPGDDVPRGPGDPPDTWRASYSVPSVLLEISEASFTLETAGAVTRLPRPGGEQQGGPGANLDRAVLAERRARRAELAEESQARRAAEARAEATAARADLETLQRDLEERGRERAAAERRVAEAERSLLAARQEAFAADQARLEAVEESEDRLRGLEQERDDLREELRATSDRVRELEDEIERLHRRVAEAERRAAARAPGSAEAEERAAAAEQEIEERKVELRAMIAAARRDRADLAEAAAAAQAIARSELRRREELERRLAEVESGRGGAIMEAARRGIDEIEALANARYAELERQLQDVEVRVHEAVETERRTREELDAVQLVAAELERRAGAAVAAEREARDAHRRAVADLERAGGQIDELEGIAREAEARAAQLAERLTAAREEGGRDRDALEEARSVARSHGSQLQHFRLRVAELEREREATRERVEDERVRALEEQEALMAAQRELETRLEVTTESEREARARIEELEAAGEEAAERAAQLERTLAAMVPIDEFRALMASHSEARAALSAELRARTGLEARLDEQAALQDWSRMTAEAQELAADALREDLAGARARIAELESQEHLSRRERRRRRRTPELEAPVTAAPAIVAKPEPVPVPVPEPVAPAPVAPAPPAPRPASDPWLPQALIRMAADDPRAAAGLIVALLPAQALAYKGKITYDLTIDELGTYRVSLDGGRGTVAPLLATPPEKGHDVDFRLNGSAESLAAAIAESGRRRFLRRRRTRIKGSKRRARKLLGLHGARLGLADLARAGIWVDPGLIYKALAYAIEPAWTEGARFAVAHEIEGPGGGTWYVIADDGERLDVTRTPPSRGPSAIVHTTTAAFAASLAGDPPPEGEQPRITGDVEAVRRLKTWTEWAQQGGPSQ